MPKDTSNASGESISIEEVNFIIDRVRAEYATIVAELVTKVASLQLELAKAGQDLDKAMSANAGIDGE